MFYIILASVIITILSFMYFWAILISKYIFNDRLNNFSLKLIVSSSSIICFWLLSYSLNAVYENLQHLYLDGDGNKQYLGTLGDLVGGTLNPVLGLFGIIVGGLAFYAQYKANKQVQEQFEKQEKIEYQNNFETKFFELIKIHRENVSEQSYTKHGINGLEEAVGRKVFRVIHKELEECLKEVKRYRKIYNEEFITPLYNVKLNQIKQDNNLKINIIDLAILDISYTILFFGVGADSQDYLLN